MDLLCKRLCMLPGIWLETFSSFVLRQVQLSDLGVPTTLSPCAQEAGLFKGGKPPAFSPQDIIEFIFFPVVNEGCRVIAEGIVDKPADLDVATVLAMGFPPYRWVTRCGQHQPLCLGCG